MNRVQARAFLKKFCTPVHVVAHCEQVSRVGEFLAERLRERGILVDPELVAVGGLVHDVVRVVDFNVLSEDLGAPDERNVWMELRRQYPGLHHADVGAQILEARGEFVLAQIVKRHKYSAIISQEFPETWEEKLVFYADKRVAHDQVVTLTERLREGRQRHFLNEPFAPEDESIQKAVFELEREIFELLDFPPEDLAALLKAHA